MTTGGCATFHARRAFAVASFRFSSALARPTSATRFRTFVGALLYRHLVLVVELDALADSTPAEFAVLDRGNPDEAASARGFGIVCGRLDHGLDLGAASGCRCIP